MIILNGKEIKEKRVTGLREKISSMSFVPKLVIVQIGDRTESNIYIEQKVLFGKKIGAEVEVKKMGEEIKTKEVLNVVQELNNDQNVHGIILQLPVPEGVDAETIINSINPKKDVDGLSAINIRKLANNSTDGIVPATAKGILTLLNEYKINVAGKNVAIIGRSLLVGKSTALLLSNHDATVTICHSKTKDLPKITKNADILIVAVGKPSFIKKEHVHENQIIIDVGITAIGDGQITGDVDFNNVKEAVYAISPVPGGVGPMTVLSLFENLIETASSQ